jgi:hypothetical protein
MITTETILQALLTASFFLLILSLIRGIGYYLAVETSIRVLKELRREIFEDIKSGNDDKIFDFRLRWFDNENENIHRYYGQMLMTQLEFVGSLFIFGVCAVLGNLEFTLLIIVIVILVALGISYYYIYARPYKIQSKKIDDDRIKFSNDLRDLKINKK